jgi:hypothetical protein
MAPQKCPSCDRTTFVHFAGEDPNVICEELLFTATLVQIGFAQSDLKRFGTSEVALSSKRVKAARATAGGRVR